MAAANDPGFNAYHKWLGIPISEQPPHFYRLLGIEPFELDHEVIAAAADRQMAHIKSFAGGQFAGESQELLNELARARVTLLNASQKTAYDRMLRQVLAPKETAAPSPPPSQVEYAEQRDRTLDYAYLAASVPTSRSSNSRYRPLRRQRNDSALLFLFVLVAAAGVAGFLYVVASGTSMADDKEVSKESRRIAEPSRDLVPPPVTEQSRTKARPAAVRERVEAPAATSPPPIVAPGMRADVDSIVLERNRAEEKVELVKFDLEDRIQRQPLDDMREDAIRLTSIEGCDFPWDIKPADGMLRESDSVRIEISGTRKVIFTVTLAAGARDARLLVIEGEIETDDGRTLPFTLRNVERVRSQVLKEGRQAANLLDTLTAEKNGLAAWLSSSALKPLAQVGPAKDRVAELNSLIPQQNQYVEALRADLAIAEKVCAMAEHLQNECAIEITSTKQDAIQP